MAVMMSKTNRSALIGLVFFISVSKLAGAFEFREVGFSGELLSLTINQCPDRLGDACYFNYSMPLQFDIKFRTRYAYESACMTFFFHNVGHRVGRVHREVTWVDEDVCQMYDSFCPVEPYDERTYHGELDLSGTAEFWSTPGEMLIHMKTQPDSRVFHVYFPIVGYS